jgi:hypothetical protein
LENLEGLHSLVRPDVARIALDTYEHSDAKRPLIPIQSGH